MVGEVKEECGIFGVQNFASGNVFPFVYWGLRAQNHRGHQSHGAVTYDGNFHIYKGLDLVPKIKKCDLKTWLDRLPGNLGVGHTRYTTSGRNDEDSLIRGTQPTFLEAEGKKVTISFNGNVVNNSSLKEELQIRFPNFSCEFDVEIIGRKLLMSLAGGEDLSSAVKTCMHDVEGAFSVTGITQKGELFAFRDPHGIKPLCCGCDHNRTIWATSSETVGLDINGFQLEFDVEPGELVVAAKDGFTREEIVTCSRKALCAFEFAYFARPDSKLGNKFVYEVREEFGRNLGQEYAEYTKDADLIISMPETGDDVAYGLHEATGVRWERSIRRHRYVTERAFISLPEERYATINRKINVPNNKLSGMKVILTDDSIVRGDTTKIVIEKIRRMGAKKVYLFSTFPRIIGPCFYGIDMATYSELIGAKHNAEEIAKIIGADAVNYQSLEGLIKSINLNEDNLCLACLTGEYPTPLAQKIADEQKCRFERGCEIKGRLYEMASVM